MTAWPGTCPWTPPGWRSILETRNQDHGDRVLRALEGAGYRVADKP